MIEQIIIISFLVYAVHATMWEGMIFEKLGDYFERTFGEFWSKPISTCPVCMGGIYGCAFYWLIYGNSPKEWLIVNIGVIGLNAILVKMMPDK